MGGTFDKVLIKVKKAGFAKDPEAFVSTLNKKIKFFALPNIKAKEEIVPEIRGIIKPVQIAAEAIRMLQNLPLRQSMSQKLLSSMGNAGAAKKIVEKI